MQKTVVLPRSKRPTLCHEVTAVAWHRSGTRTQTYTTATENSVKGLKSGRKAQINQNERRGNRTISLEVSTLAQNVSGRAMLIPLTSSDK